MICQRESYLALVVLFSINLASNQVQGLWTAQQNQAISSDSRLGETQQHQSSAQVKQEPSPRFIEGKLDVRPGSSTSEIKDKIKTQDATKEDDPQLDTRDDDFDEDAVENSMKEPAKKHGEGSPRILMGMLAGKIGKRSTESEPVMNSMMYD